MRRTPNLSNNVAAPTTHIISEYDATAQDLRRRLDELHTKVYSSAAMGKPSDVSYFWRHILPTIDEIVQRRGICRVLEFGSGYSGLSQYLAENRMREKVHLTLHDIITTNKEWLKGQADAIVVGPAPALRGTFDIVVSSFVVEHMTDPSASLQAIWNTVNPGGTLFLICPRYDFPFLLPPACDHLHGISRIRIMAELLRRRIAGFLSGEPRFLLLSDAAAFYLPYRRDRDAIHLVARRDLWRFFARRGARVSDLRVTWPTRWHERFNLGWLKGWLVSHRMIAAIGAKKS